MKVTNMRMTRQEMIDFLWAYEGPEGPEGVEQWAYTHDITQLPKVHCQECKNKGTPICIECTPWYGEAFENV